MPMEKPTPTTQNITLTITHPEKERYELCEISCGAATTLEDLKEQICAKTGLQARILVMAKRYEADGDLDEAQRAALRAQAYVNWVPAEPGDTLGSVGYRNGDQCAFTYLGPAEEDLRPEFRAAEDVSVSSDSSDEDEA